MNLIPLRVILIPSILLVAKFATVKAHSDEQDPSATDSYEPTPASSCFDYFPGLSMMSRKIEHTLLHCTSSLDEKNRDDTEKKKKQLKCIEISKEIC